jgi:hypothetical protein
MNKITIEPSLSRDKDQIAWEAYFNKNKAIAMFGSSPDNAFGWLIKSFPEELIPGFGLKNKDCHDAITLLGMIAREHPEILNLEIEVKEEP